MKRFKQVVLILYCVFYGCTTSSVTTLWKAENMDFFAYRKVLVMALTNADSSLQESMEAHLVGDLKNLGYNAVSSFHEYGPNTFNNMNMQAVYGKIKDGKWDAILTIVLLNKKEEVRFIPSNFYLSTSGVYHYNYSGFDMASVNPFSNPGYFVTYTDYFWITGLYDVAYRKLGYSVQMHSLNQPNLQLMAHDYSRMIIKNMAKQKVISKKQNLKPF